MLRTKDLIKDVEPQYVDMLSKVNIPDFYKTIAFFSGLEMNCISDEVIKKYLQTWAKNKYRFYKMLGNKIRLDMPIEYSRTVLDKADEFTALTKEYPAFVWWLNEFAHLKTNKIEYGNLSFAITSTIQNLFGSNYSICGTTITHFFKDKLNAPDDLVTKIGRLYENDKISGTYTISIDPVDMMLASENPYGWHSCYKLIPSGDSHADGCLAAILDTSSLITYIWDKEGKFSFNSGYIKSYDFKSIRYKRIRGWIAINPEFNAIHFNELYPSKGQYPEEFSKQLRYMVEEVVDKYNNKKTIWKANSKVNKADCERMYCGYGYAEYDADYIYVDSDLEKDVYWEVYNEPIECPCGCGFELPGNDYCDDDEYEYDGSGFNCHAFSEAGTWCDWAEAYCYEDDCENCSIYRESHPYCQYEERVCHNYDYNDLEQEEGQITNASEENCEGCPLYKIHHPEETDNNSSDDAADSIAAYVASITGPERDALRQTLQFIEPNTGANYTITYGE